MIILAADISVNNYVRLSFKIRCLVYPFFDFKTGR